MGYDEHRSTAAGWTATLVLVMLGLFAGLSVVGIATLFWFRTVSMHRTANAERDRAIMAEVAARQAAEEATEMLARAQGAASEENAASHPANVDRDVRQLMVMLDADGNLFAEDRPMTLDELQRQLQRADKPFDSLVIKVDERCLFKAVARMLSTCEEAGIEDVQLKSMDGSTVD